MDRQQLQLLREYQDGAWDEWDTQTRPRLLKFFVFHGVGREESSDLTQETLRRVARRIALFPIEDHERLEAWVFTIARHVYVGWVRTRKRRPDPVTLEGGREPAVHPDEWVPGEVFDIRDLTPPLQRALAGLSPRQREFFILRHIHGMEPCEIAAKHGCAPGTVYQHLTAAKRRLKTVLESWLGKVVR